MVENLIIQLRIVKLKHYSHFNVVLKADCRDCVKSLLKKKFKKSLSTDAGGKPEGVNPWA